MNRYKKQLDSYSKGYNDGLLNGLIIGGGLMFFAQFIWRHLFIVVKP